MKVYKCDCCGTMMENPYRANMKQFRIVAGFDLSGVFPENSRSRVKVHFCEDCFRGLKEIGLKALKEKENV